MSIKRRIKTTIFSTGRKLCTPQKKDTLGTNVWENFKNSDGKDIFYMSEKSCEEFLRSEIVISTSYRIIK